MRRENRHDVQERARKKKKVKQDAMSSRTSRIGDRKEQDKGSITK